VSTHILLHVIQYGLDALLFISLGRQRSRSEDASDRGGFKSECDALLDQACKVKLQCTELETFLTNETLRVMGVVGVVWMEIEKELSSAQTNHMGSAAFAEATAS
jgi:hypothetical protein